MRGKTTGGNSRAVEEAPWRKASAKCQRKEGKKKQNIGQGQCQEITGHKGVGQWKEEAEGIEDEAEIGTKAGVKPPEEVVGTRTEARKTKQTDKQHKPR